jgi:hypothetical protein
MSSRLSGYTPGQQQFDYPLHTMRVESGANGIVVAPGAQTGLFETVGRLDPHTYRPNEFFANNWVYEGLVSYAADGVIEPALASAWSITDLDNGDQRYTFTLRSGVTFHDGSAWDCSVAKLNFDHVFARPLVTGDWHGWYDLPKVLKPNWVCSDAMTLVLETEGKYYPFLQELTYIRPLRMLSPASFVGGAQSDPLTQNSCHTGWDEGQGITGNGVTIRCAGITAVSGTGPWKYVDTTFEADGTTTSQANFAKHENYWKGAAPIDTLTVKRYESAAAVKAALLDGSLDLVVGSGVLNPADLEDVRLNHASTHSVYFGPVIQNRVVVMNGNLAPTNDIEVRKSIIHGVNKAAIIQKELSGSAAPVTALFPTSAPYCGVDLLPQWDYDLEKARMLACYEDDHDGHDHAGETCGCAALEADHPFTLDCTNAGAMATAEAKLTGESCSATTESCSAVVDGVMPCQIAFFVLQAHHDMCEHDTLSTTQEGLVHQYEASCLQCVANRPFDSAIRNCVVPDCKDSAPAMVAYNTVSASCTSDACCGTPELQNAYKLLWEYHEICDHDDVPTEVEGAIHAYENTCESYAECNTPLSMSDGYDPTVCVPPPAFEWAGVFSLAASSHTWSMQKVGGAYADATMRLVLVPTNAPTAETMEAGEAAGGSLLTGDACAVIEDGESMTPAAGGSCFELHVGTGEDSTFTIVTSGISGVVVYAQHVPIEFERNRHYLYDSAGTDIEPIAQESAGGDNAHHAHAHGDMEICACAAAEADHPYSLDCTDSAAVAASATKLQSCVKSTAGCDAVTSGGLMVCRGAYFHLHYIHGWCGDQDMTLEQEQLLHDYEEFCPMCLVERKFDASWPACVQPACTDVATAVAAAGEHDNDAIVSVLWPT